MGVLTGTVVRTLPLLPRFVVWRVARRYVAGPSLDDAVACVRGLNAQGMMATIDVLGESVEERAKAEAFTEEYLRVYERIAAEGLDANVSVKPTMLLLHRDEEIALELLDRLAAVARRQGNFLRIDMEDATVTDATLHVYHELQRRHGCVGTVLQCYMRRTRRDIAALPAEGANIRLCKGIYVEPRRIAWKGYETIRRNFVHALEQLFRQGVYVGVATHDEYLICEALALVDRMGIPRDRYEFQMLLGVDEELRDLLVERGHRLRVYVPYGEDWYQYCLRRLRENPEIAGHVMRAFFAPR